MTNSLARVFFALTCRVGFITCKSYCHHSSSILHTEYRCRGDLSVASLYLNSDISSTPTVAYTSQAFQANEEDTTVDMGLLKTLDEAFVCWFENMGISERNGTRDSTRNVVAMEANLHEDGGDKHEGASKTLKSSSTSSTSEVPKTSKNVRVKADNTSDTNGKVGSGLSRGGRRQFAAILDEFWGDMFDFHGKLIHEAKTKRVDILLGLDLETTSMSTIPENAVNESSQKSSPKARGTIYPTTSSYYSTPVQHSIPSAVSAYVMQTRTPSLLANMQLVDAQYLNQCNGQDRHMIHDCEIPSNDRATSADRNFLDQLRSNSFFESFDINYGGQFTHTLGQNGFDSLFTSGLHNPTTYGSSWLWFGSLYNEPSLAGTMSSPGYTKKYHSLPDVSELNSTSRNSSLNDKSGQRSDLLCSRSSLNRMQYEQFLYPNIISTTEELPLEFNEYAPSEHHKGVFSEPMNLNLDSEPLWAKPYEQSFTTMIKSKNQGDKGVTNKSGVVKKFFSYTESEAMILRSLRVCIMKLLKLEASNWLFTQNGGCDEEIIDRIAITERILLEDGINKVDHMSEMENLANFLSFMPDCGDNCIWQATLIVSFGVWCIHRIIKLLLVESRPELWGKYTCVLNRLQGILEPAFFKPRSPLISCKCLAPSEMHEDEFQQAKRSTGRGYNTTASLILEIIKNAEVAISERKGRAGTAAGNIAFPKGKENVASVLKRYKRRLSNTSSGSNVGSFFSSRKGPLCAS